MSGTHSPADFISAYAEIVRYCKNAEGILRSISIKAQQGRDFGVEIRDLRECLGYIDGKGKIIQEGKND